jgi:hypothetical protein
VLLSLCGVGAVRHPLAGRVAADPRDRHTRGARRQSITHRP